MPATTTTPSGRSRAMTWGQSHDRLGPRRRSVAVATLGSTACLHPEPLDRLGHWAKELWAKWRVENGRTVLANPRITPLIAGHPSRQLSITTHGPLAETVLRQPLTK